MNLHSQVYSRVSITLVCFSDHLEQKYEYDATSID